MKLSENQEQKDEVSGWLAKLEEPVRIEEGYNHVLAGRFDKGISVLAGYEDDTRFNTWWPLWYYLGVAYQATGERDMAKERFLQVLKLSPSNVEAMDELAALYEAEGNMEMADKYRKKIQVVKQNAELDRAEKAEGMS